MHKQKDSEEETDGLRDSSTTNLRSGKRPDDADADPDLIWEADAKLYEAFSRLRAVRVPGKGRLTMQEAMEVASDQYEVYRTWVSKGGPLGKLKAWVEGKEVFKALGPPVFESFSFNWPRLDEGVLQITTEHDRKQVVLYNLRLQDVPPERSVHDEPLPNGQHLVLTITRHVTLVAAAGSGTHSQTERFSISIAIQSKSDGTRASKSDLLDLNRVAGKQDDTEYTKDSREKVAGMPSLTSRRSRVVALGRPSASIAYGVVIVLLAFLFIQNESLKSLLTSSAVVQVADGRSDLQTSNHGQVQDDSLNETELRSLESTPVIVAQNTERLNHVKEGSLITRKPTISWQLNDLVSPRGEVMMKIAASELSQAEPFGNTSDERLAHYRELEKRFAAVAALSDVSVRVQNSQATQADKSERVRLLFAQAFQASTRFRVLNDSDRSKAELVIALRFEPTERASGFVFVDIRDSNGKFIWQDFANCTESFPDEHDESFSVAAGSLVSSLEEVMSTSNNH